LRQGGKSTTLNCGYGRGYSVRELITMVESVAGRKIAQREEPRRPGDPPTLIAEASRIRETLGWQPRHDNLETIVSTALAWERKLAAGIWRQP
jgi:UDP-glucose 4-epimerase